MGGFAVEFGEVLYLEKLFDVLCLDLGDDRDERVEPRPINFDADVWLEVDGYCLFGVNKYHFFLFSFFVPDSACY